MTYSSKLDNDINVDVVKTKTKLKKVDEDELDKIINENNEILNKIENKRKQKLKNPIK